MTARLPHDLDWAVSDLIRAVIDRYMLNIQGFGRTATVLDCGPLNDHKMWHAAKVQISSLSGDRQQVACGGEEERAWRVSQARRRQTTQMWPRRVRMAADPD